MLIYALADLHGRIDRLKRVKKSVAEYRPDIMIIAGDIVGLFNHRNYLKELDQLGIHILIVRGNSDIALADRDVTRKTNISNLNLKGLVLKKCQFLGINGTVPLPFHSKIKLFDKAVFNKATKQMTNINILVAHPPPLGTLDTVFGRIPAGCLIIKKLILKHQPDLYICGHIHEQRGSAHLGKTLVVNCSMGRIGSGVLIDYHNGSAAVIDYLD